MFKFLKEKLKKAVSDISEDIEEKGEEEVKETVESLPEEEQMSPEDEKEMDAASEQAGKQGFFEKIKGTFTKKEELEKVPEEELDEVPVEQIEKEAKEEDIIEKKKEETKAAEEKVKEKVEKKKVPSISDLAERKEKPEEPAAEEPVLEESKKKPYEEIPTSHTEPAENAEKPEEIPPAEKKEEEKGGKESAPVEKKPEEPAEEEKKGFFGRLRQKIVTKKIGEKQFDDMFWNLELILLENNVAVEVIEMIKKNLKEKLVDNPIPRGSIEDTITDTLKQTIGGLFDVEKLDLLAKADEKKPLVICFVGINGSGKTTTIAKFAKYFQDNNRSCILAAADTFRAAAIDQLQAHADKLGVKLIKHDYGADAAAVAFDAVKHAESKDIDIVLIDTAGRMHSNTNLMEEMEKLVRVANPDLKIFVGESITGNDCTEQAKRFNDSIGIDGIVLSKADIDEKGGAAISVSHITGKPILFMGTGQEYADLKEFDPNIVLESLEL